MSNVEFEEENSQGQSLYKGFDTFESQPKLVRLVLKTGIVKDPKQANNVLIGLAIVVVAVTLYVIFVG